MKNLLFVSIFIIIGNLSCFSQEYYFNINTSDSTQKLLIKELDNIQFKDIRSNDIMKIILNDSMKFNYFLKDIDIIKMTSHDSIQIKLYNGSIDYLYLYDIMCFHFDTINIINMIEESYHNNISLINYPNPFDKQTNIKFSISKSCSLVYYIVDINGIEILKNDLGILGKGEYSIFWDGRDQLNNLVPSGIYTMALKNGNDIKLIKMIKIGD